MCQLRIEFIRQSDGRVFRSKLPELRTVQGHLENTLQLVRDFPDLDIFTGDDDLLWPLVKAGGSITATANIIPQLLASIWQAAMDGAENPPAAHQVASDVWSLILNHYPIVESLKECLAHSVTLRVESL